MTRYLFALYFCTIIFLCSILLSDHAGFCAGQHDDARMCLSIALTATRMGATTANHTEVVRLLKKKDSDGKEVMCGAVVKDKLTGKPYVTNISILFMFIQQK